MEDKKVTPEVTPPASDKEPPMSEKVKAEIEAGKASLAQHQPAPETPAPDTKPAPKFETKVEDDPENDDGNKSKRK